MQCKKLIGQSKRKCTETDIAKSHLPKAKPMIRKFKEALFFGNYFMVILGILLSIETNLQLHLPLNNWTFYILIATCILVYYSYAYSTASENGATPNIRSQWYERNKLIIAILQNTRLLIIIGLAVFYASRLSFAAFELPAYYWIIAISTVIAAIGYYGLLPLHKGHFFNLRANGWIKALTIGYVWAAIVTFLPIMDLYFFHHKINVSLYALSWFFVKNWMFCATNAILFDIKDFDDDSNRNLKTMIVQLGLNKVIYLCVIPLIIIGILCLFGYCYYIQVPISHYIVNMIPYLLLILVSFRLTKHKYSIFYYLFIIDGVLIVKALCGIITALYL